MDAFIKYLEKRKVEIVTLRIVCREALMLNLNTMFIQPVLISCFPLINHLWV